MAERHQDAATQTVIVAGASVVYREFGPRSGVPLVVLQHLGANLDNGDPRILDGLARDRRVISVGYRGVGGSTGRVRSSIEEMAADTVGVIRALGHDRVDLLGQSMGGMVAQAVGGEDSLVPIANASALARHLPTATVTVHPHAGHGVIFQHHAEFVAAAREFLRA